MQWNCDPVSIERSVRQLLANKASGNLTGIWLLVAKRLRLGTWDLLGGWTGRQLSVWNRVWNRAWPCNWCRKQRSARVVFGRNGRCTSLSGLRWPMACLSWPAIQPTIIGCKS